tara:strand:- start:603 stop:902 length:300 start_codon:yes stop_codon:yes gene_type:complete
VRNNLTKKDLINSIYMRVGISKKVIEVLVDDFFDIVINNLIRNKIVKISNFGTFYLKNKKQRLGRNPKTKEEAVISKRNVITFKSSKELKKYINYNEKS